MLGKLSKEQIELILQSNVIGRIGCHAKNKTYVVPITYCYYKGAVYGHTSPGLKTELLNINPNVCFEVDQIQNYANWQSVIAWGMYVQLEGKAAMEALQIISNCLTPHYTSQTSLPDTKQALVEDSYPNARINSIVYKIELYEKSGRFEKRT